MACSPTLDCFIMNIPNLLFSDCEGITLTSIDVRNIGVMIVRLNIELTDGPEEGRVIELDFDIATAQALKKHLAWNIAYAKSMDNELD